MRKGTDLDGVDPARREATLRRVRVLKDYVALNAPTKADRKAAAARVGLSPSHFDVLVRAWKASGRASSLPGAQMKGGRAGRQQLDAARTSVIERIARELADKPFRSVTKAVRGALERDGHPPLSRTTIARRVRAALAGAGGAPRFADGAALALISFRLDAPIAAEAGAALPSMALVTSLPSRTIAAWRVLDRPLDAIGARALLVAALRAMPAEDRAAIGRDGPPTIVATISGQPDWAELARVIEWSGWRTAAPPLSDPQMARAMFGARIAEIGIRARERHEGASAPSPVRRLADLERVLGLTLPPPPLPTADARTDDLAAYLAARLSES